MDCSPPGSSVHGMSQARTLEVKWSVVKEAQSCPALCNPMDCTVHGILQARILEWVAFPFSRESSQPRDWTQVSHISGRFFTSWDTRKTGVGCNFLLQEIFLTQRSNLHLLYWQVLFSWASGEAPHRSCIYLFWFWHVHSRMNFVPYKDDMFGKNCSTGHRRGKLL